MCSLRNMPRLQNEVDYTVDEKLRTAAMTEAGVAKVEKCLASITYSMIATLP